MKKCTTCGIEKILSEYHFNFSKNTYVSQCKLCKNTRSKEKYHSNKEIGIIRKNKSYLLELDKLKGVDEWFVIPYHSKYLINKNGDIIATNDKPKLLKQSVREGYHRVWIFDDANKTYQANVHTLVMITFNPTSDNTLIINHIDGNKSNNSLTNLEWVTYTENLKHAYDTKIKSGNNEPYAYDEIYDMISRLFNKESYSSISSDYGCSVGYLSLLANRKLQKQAWIDFLTHIINELRA